MTTPRTTSEQVASIIDVDASVSLDSFMLTATLIVTDACVGPSVFTYNKAYPIPYNAERLELIERWLSAHFYSIYDPQASQETAGDVSATYFGKVDLLLEQTRWGQQAIMLDTLGGLARLQQYMIKGKRLPSVAWLGKACRPTRRPW